MFFALLVGVVLCFIDATLAHSALGTVVVDAAWRFTAVTDRLIRIEYDQSHRFVDEPTITFVRSAATGTWISTSTSASGLWRTLATRRVSLRYRRDVPPAAGTVEISERNGTHKWRWGDNPAVGNLGGTARTLDGFAETLDLNCNHKVSPTMDNSEMHCAWGVVSKMGWAMINDTGTPILRDEWFAPSRNSTDISIFLHGLDFAGAMQDYIYAAGHAALPPRYALGTLFTRWFNFDTDSVMHLVDEFESRSMPLDVWMFDMNWHLYGPWGSFTWNQQSYPKLQEFLDWIQSRGLRIGANTHDSDGIHPSENTYGKMCAALNRTPCDGTIHFDLYNKTFSMAFEDIVWSSVQTKGKTQGIDFAWIDYQQGERNHFRNTTIPNINPTMVLNTMRSTDPMRHGENKRSLVLSRWGGYGSHRYPIGFSGDQKHTWKALAFLPYFTSTAANVAYGYWSHDTKGGEYDLSTDYELSVRWAQMSAWSPVLRFHGGLTEGCAASGTCARIVPWTLPDEFFTAVREAARQRDQMIPYIYTAAFGAVRSGLVLARPMYYYDPMDSALYNLPKQYLFGHDMVISPITVPSAPNLTGLEATLGAVTWDIYAPRSAVGWVDRLNGGFFSQEIASGAYGIKDVPGLVRQGAVIPMRPYLRGESSLARAIGPLRTIEFRIAPAEAFYHGTLHSNSGLVVDDDGISTDYMHGKYTTTTCNYTFIDRTFKISLAQHGDFDGRPVDVLVRFSLPQLPPVRVKSVGAFAGAVSNLYDHELVGSIVTFANADLKQGLVLELEIDAAYPSAVFPNFIGLLGRVRRARYVKDALDSANVPYGDGRVNITSICLSATHMSPAFAETLPTLWSSAVQQAANLVQQDATLQNDPRRRSFVSKMMVAGSVHDPSKPHPTLFV